MKTPEGTSSSGPADEFDYLQPEVSSISPAHGWTTGGTVVTVDGKNLTDGAVLFGSAQASASSCSDDQCTATAPAGTAGTVDVTVRAADDITKSPKVTADEFTFQAEPPPKVTGVSPDAGTQAGGDQVTIRGTDLAAGTVQFGTASPSGSYACSDTSCIVAAPAHSAGQVDVTVTARGATSATSAADVFTYSAPGTPSVTGVSPGTGSVVGGDRVTITGVGLTNGSVTFGGTPATSVTCGTTTCTATTPARAAGAVDVRVSVQNGASTLTSPTSSKDTFTYASPPAPTITGVSPATGPRTGGTAVVVTGTDLRGGAVTFGGTSATGVTCSDTSCAATSPAGAAGDVTVSVTTAGGTAATSPQDSFAYGPVGVSEVAVPGLSGTPQAGGTAHGPNGRTWFVEPNLDTVGYASSAGPITTYPTHDSNIGGRSFIVAGPDGRMYYTEANQNAIVAIDAAGNQTAYLLPGHQADIRGITAGPDGRIWFTLFGSGAIGAMTTDGTVTTYHVPDPAVGPYQIVAGPDGRLWFTEWGGNAVGAITTDGVVTEYPLPDVNANSWGIANGPDGRLWLTENTGSTIAAVTADGVVTDYPVFGQDDLEGITDGPDGRLWFTDPDLDQVSALDPSSGDITEYALPGGTGGNGQPEYPTVAPDGSIWVTEFGQPDLVHVTGLTASVRPTVSDVAPATGAASGGTTVTITGTNFQNASQVKFGSTVAASYSVVDPGHIAVVSPSGPSGVVDVTVTTPSGTSAIATADEFGYGVSPPQAPTVAAVSPAFGTTAGGDQVTITGHHLNGGVISFGGAAAGGSCTATACTVTAPANDVGTVDVSVTTGAGVSGASAADEYTYEAPQPAAPTVSSVQPASGAAGDSVTVKGSHLGGASVTFGLNEAAQSQTTCSDTSCVVNVPRGAAGSTIDVRVDTAGGRSPRVQPADQFTYGSSSPARQPVTESLLASPAAVLAGQQVTLTARVSAGSGNPSGTATFTVGGTTLCSRVAVSAGSAACHTARLPAGTDAVSAAYSGDSSFTPTTATTMVDVVRMSATLTAPAAPFMAATTVAVRWAGTISGGTVTQYALRVRSAGPTAARFGSWHTPASWASLHTTSLTETGIRAGFTYCFAVQAVDSHGLHSAWSSERCVAAALDDRSLKASGGWVRTRGSKDFDRTVTTANGRRKGITLSYTVGPVDRVAILASRGARAGTLGISVGGKSVGRLILAGKRGSKVWFALPAFPARHGRLVITLVSKGRAVAIDGMAVSHS